MGLGDGPSTWEELREGGRAIKQKFNVAVGIGMSNELDSNMAARALMWSYGASVQNEIEQVVLDSPETIAAVTYLVRLYTALLIAPTGRSRRPRTFFPGTQSRKATA